MPGSKPSKNVDLFQKQIQTAYREKNHDAFEAMVEYERHVLIARLRKS